MKPIHILLIVFAAGLFAMAYAVSQKRKKASKSVSESSKVNSNVQNTLATISTTTVTDPTTGEEYIVSYPGENAIDQMSGTASMNSAISAVLTNIDNNLGITPPELVMKTYAPEGSLMGSTKIPNPYLNNLPLGKRANQSIGLQGDVEYSCSAGNGSLNGPGYYESVTGQDLFGMFCKI